MIANIKAQHLSKCPDARMLGRREQPQWWLQLSILVLLPSTLSKFKLFLVSRAKTAVGGRGRKCCWATYWENIILKVSDGQLGKCREEEMPTGPEVAMDLVRAIVCSSNRKMTRLKLPQRIQLNWDAFNNRLLPTKMIHQIDRKTASLKIWTSASRSLVQ